MDLFRRASLKRRLVFWFIAVGWLPVALASFHVYRHEADRRRHEGLAFLWEVHQRRAAAVDRWVHAINHLFDLAESQMGVLMGGESPNLGRILTGQARSLTNGPALWIVEGRQVRPLDPANAASAQGETIPGDVLKDLQDLKTRSVGRLSVSPSGSAVRVFSSVPLYGGTDTKIPAAHLVLSIPGRDPFRDLLSEEAHVPSLFLSYVQTEDRYYDPIKDVFTRFPRDLQPTHSVRERHHFDGAPPVLDGAARNGDFWVAESLVTGTPWKLVTLFSLSGLDEDLNNLRHRLLLVVVLSALGFVGLAGFLSRRLTVPLDAMRVAAMEISRGNLAVRYDAARGDEFGEVAESLNAMVRSLEQRLDMQQTAAILHETMVTAEDMEHFVDAMLLRLMEVTGAEAGAGYVLDAHQGLFRPACSVGLRAEALGAFDAGLREGELGRALTTGRLVRLREAPPHERYVYRAVAGEMVPKEVLTVPVKGDDRIAVIFSLVSLGSFAEENIRVLEEVRHAMDTACARFLAVERIRHMGRELSEKNAQLQEQKKELEIQAEELQVQAEELVAQNIALEAQQKELDAANRLKDEFLATMSHELRTPLHSILALSRLLQGHEADLDESRRRDYVHLIEKNGTVLLELINDVLDLSKIEAGRLDVFPEAVDPEGVVRTLAENLRPLAEKKGVEFHVHVEKGLSRVETDAARLYQILQNLAANALKFTDRGKVTIHVRHHGDDVVFSVEDTGIGIPESDLPYIFEKFRQVNGTTSRRHEGTGLGLAIAKKLTERLGGALWAESRLGHGSVFHLKIPALWKGPEAVKAADDPRKADRTDAPTVVVVDDDPKILASMRDWLEAEGYRTETFGSVAEAVAFCEKAPPAVIFADVVLPDGDGYQVVRRCRRWEALKKVPVVLMSAARDDGTARAMGADGFVGKPLSRARVLYHVDRLLRLKDLPFDPSTKRILVVEDDEAALLQLQAVLEGAGYRTAAAATGREALDLVGRERPDGIVLDLKLPDLDGWSVLEKLRAREDTRDVPVLVFTAQEITPEALGRLKANHIFQLVLKGDIRRRELVRRVDAMMKESGQETAGQSSRARDERPSEESGIGEAGLSQVQGPPRRGRVLIVEDHPDNRMLLADYLGAEFDLAEAADGEEGWRLIQEWKPDVVLLDISLPGMDGLEVARRVWENEETRRIPLIAMTAHVMGGDREKVLRAGFSDYVGKPFRLDDLRTKLRTWLAGLEGRPERLGEDDHE
ncbi:MAG: response regulator [Desulfosoma sp.]